MRKNNNDSQNKDLQQPEGSAYEPAYKEYQKTGENQAQELANYNGFLNSTSYHSKKDIYYNSN